MTFLKSIILLFTVFLFGWISASAQSTDITIQWTGTASSIQFRSGQQVTYPDAKHVSTNETGGLILQYDIPGKITSVKEEQITLMPADSASSATLRSLTISQPSAITFSYLYNDGVST